MQTRTLRTLVEIHTVGSFATAASRLNMTLSAVSMQMKALEAELGAALFDRSFRPPRLTPLGRAICDQARQILTAESELRAACAPGDRLTGRYRVGFVPTASVRLLPTFLLNARKLSSTVSFDVVTGLSEALEAKVRSGDLDFAVVTENPSRDSVLQSKTLREERLAFAAPATPVSHAPRVLIEKMSFLHFMPSSGIGKLISEHMEDFVGSGHGHVVLDSVEAIMECVNRGVGFTLLPEPDIRRYADPATRVFTAGPTELSRRVALIWSSARRHHAQAALVSDLFGG
ncbi:MAG: LysR family transcriptional regulator [Pseudomonadota bacterium]